MIMIVVVAMMMMIAGCLERPVTFERGRRGRGVMMMMVVVHDVIVASGVVRIEIFESGLVLIHLLLSTWSSY